MRVNTGGLPLYNASGSSFPLLQHLRGLAEAGQVGEWKVFLAGARGRIAGRICALRKSASAIERTQKRLKDKAIKKVKALRPETLEYAKYVIVFTTWDGPSAADILEWYRVRWQIELAFKRLIAGSFRGQALRQSGMVFFVFGNPVLIPSATPPHAKAARVGGPRLATPPRAKSGDASGTPGYRASAARERAGLLLFRP